MSSSFVVCVPCVYPPKNFSVPGVYPKFFFVYFTLRGYTLTRSLWHIPVDLERFMKLIRAFVKGFEVGLVSLEIFETPWLRFTPETMHRATLSHK